ncbi:MAG: ATP-dependent zinc metalloprotease FtsH [Proteobacteria bacterium]|nr:ATP-dependent zinc metalloprotease FtsH [Pseudomonadota bacterium]
MDKKKSLTIIYFIIAFIILLTLERYFLTQQALSINYSEFKSLVKDKLVNNLVISKEFIEGKFIEGGAERVAQLRNLKDQKEINFIKNSKAFYTIRVEDPELVKELTEKGISYSGKQEVTWVKTLLSWIIPIAILIAFWSFILKKMGAPGEGLMAIGKSKAKVYVEGETNVTFKDVAGVDEAKEELREIIEFLKTPEKFLKLGGKIPKGILLVGPPGTGKTLLARAVAGEAGVPFLSLSGSAFVEMFVGVGAARVRDLFQQAEKLAPCIIFIDEIDALGKARGISPISGVDEREQTLAQLLSEMDGFDTKKGVIIMAATNRPEIIDPALLRPGRFDRHVLVDRPDIKGREEIFKVHTAKVKLAPDVNIKVLASMTPGMVGADIANIVNEAALLAARKGKNQVEMKDFEEAIERAIAGLEKKSRVINKKEKEIVAFHECGHAIVAASLPNADPVRRISIIPRGISALGYTMQLPTEDRYLLTKSELLDRLAVLLGGRCAEEIIFNEVSTGAQNDLERATDIAKRMVKNYGMSENLGPLAFEQNRLLFLESQWERRGDYSEETAKIIDEEVRRLINEACERAKKILKEKIYKLRELASLLMEKEIIEGEDLKKLLED